MSNPDRQPGRHGELDSGSTRELINFLQHPPASSEVSDGIKQVEDMLRERDGMHEWMSLWPKRHAVISLSSLEAAIRQVLVKAATERGWHAVVISHRYGGRVTTVSHAVPTYSREEIDKKERSRLTVFARTGNGTRPAKDVVSEAYHRDLTPELEEIKANIEKAGRTQEFLIQRHEYDPRT